MTIDYIDSNIIVEVLLETKYKKAEQKHLEEMKIISMKA